MALSDIRIGHSDIIFQRVCGLTRDRCAFSFLWEVYMSEYKALYRKYRPYDFDDVSGQDGVTDILKYEVANDRLSHAYLFCGSRGTGKTSCAKILAKAVNCLNPRNGNPCNECAACRSIDSGAATDVIEMDAASNNGVDNVRDMKDEIAFTPAELRFRVYVIDEVHMMSSSAFNALLKTLEEPPAYVIFILATTEFHKLPTTIVSRCQRFDFRRISNDNIVARLMHISAKENIELTEDGARVIARVSRGGMRDAVSLLELCWGAGRRVDADCVFETVGNGNRDRAYSLIGAIRDGNYDIIYSAINDIVMKSGDVSVFWQELIDCYRDVMVVKNTDRAREYLDLTEGEYAQLSALAERFSPALLSYHVTLLENALADMQRAFNSKRSIAEIALTRMVDAKSALTMEALSLRIEELEKQISMLKLGVAPIGNDPDSVKVLPTTKLENADEVEKSLDHDTQAQTAQPSPMEKSARPVIYDKWQSVVERIGELKTSLSVQFMKSCAYVCPDGTYLIRMNSFFANRLSGSNADLTILRGIIAEKEGVPADGVKLVIEPMDATRSSDLTLELENAIDK